VSLQHFPTSPNWNKGGLFQVKREERGRKEEEREGNEGEKKGEKGREGKEREWR